MTNIWTLFKATPGRKTLVFADSEEDLQRVVRRLMFIADTIVFNVGTYLDEPALSVFPIQDNVESPVLGVTTVLDPGSNRPRFPQPVEAAEVLTLTALLWKKANRKDTVLGYEWGRPDHAWQRSSFTRTSEPFRNERGGECHIAVGLGYQYQISTYDWLLGDARRRFS